MNNENGNNFPDSNRQSQSQVVNPMPQQPQPPNVPSVFTGSIIFSAISFAAWSIVAIFTVELMFECQTGGCSGLFLLLPIMIALATELPALILLIAAGIQLFRYRTSPVFPTIRKRFLVSLLLFLLPVASLCLVILLGIIR